jgi:hypothetical protein
MIKIKEQGTIYEDEAIGIKLLTNGNSKGDKGILSGIDRMINKKLLEILDIIQVDETSVYYKEVGKGKNRIIFKISYEK